MKAKSFSVRCFVSSIIDSYSLLIDAVMQLLSSLTLSPNDAQNIIQVVVDSTDLQPPFAVDTQPPAPHPTLQTQNMPSPVVQTQNPPPSLVQTQPPAPPIVQTQPAPPVVHTPQPALPILQTPQLIIPPAVVPPAVALMVRSLPHLLTTMVIVNGEERFQHHYNGFSFNIPHAGADGPFYFVNRGRRVGIFDTWCPSFFSF